MSSAKILVVEDEKIVSTNIENSLKRLGYVRSSPVNFREEIIRKIEDENPLNIINIPLSANINFEERDLQFAIEIAFSKK